MTVARGGVIVSTPPLSTLRRPFLAVRSVTPKKDSKSFLPVA